MSSRNRRYLYSGRRLLVIVTMLTGALVLLSPTAQARIQSALTKETMARTETAISALGASASTWSNVPSPNTLIPQGDLKAVSCAAEGTCEAVGSYMNGSGITVPLAEALDGTSWALQTLPAQPQVDESWLNGVSCPTTDDCEAVGGYEDSSGVIATFAEVWDGTSWSIQSTGAPEVDGNLYGVSCIGPETCEAVGTDPASYAAIAEQWNGTGWTLQDTGNPNATLYAVSCAGPDACEAVGTASNQGLAESWTGTSWSAQTIDTNAAFYGVSCTGPDACEAVGSDIGDDTAVAAAWDGTSWNMQDVQSTSGSPITGSLTAVACITANSCEAFGGLQNSPGGDVIAVVWNGTSWLLQSAAQAPNATTNTGGISCTAIEDCEAVGDYSSGEGFIYLPFAEGWDGTGWSLEPSQDAVGVSNSDLAAISCFDAANCEAVGNSVDEAGNIVTLAEGWNGTNWSIQTMPSPSSASWLDGISCISASRCETVGYYDDAEDHRVGFAESWDGTDWAMQSIPVPSDAITSQVAAISCASTNDCEAVGIYTTTASGGSKALGLVDIWNGTKWKPQSIPDPGTSISSGYEGVSCTSADDCEAVGDYFTPPPSFEEYPLVARWNGTKWTRQPAPYPSGSTGSLLSGVSCHSADDCEAVGNSNSTAAGVNVDNPMAISWNGTAWDLQAPLDGFDTKDSSLSGVSCATSATCEAVGSSENSSGNLVPLIESWKKGNWYIQMASEPQTPFSGWLQSIFCSARSQCMAAGSDSPSPTGSVTWIEQYSG